MQDGQAGGPVAPAQGNLTIESSDGVTACRVIECELEADIESRRIFFILPYAGEHFR